MGTLRIKNAKLCSRPDPKLITFEWKSWPDHHHRNHPRAKLGIFFPSQPLGLNLPQPHWSRKWIWWYVEDVDTLISLTNVKSGLLILKKNSTLHVYWFLRFFPPSTPRLLHLCTSFFPKNPTLHVYSNLHVYWFCNFCTPPRLFQPPCLVIWQLLHPSTFIPTSTLIKEMRVQMNLFFQQVNLKCLVLVYYLPYF